MTTTAIAYTDGSCIPNPGAGGWAYRIEWPDGTVTERYGTQHDTTCYQMERMALERVCEHFVYVRRASRLIVRTDCKAVIGLVDSLYPYIAAEYVPGHVGIAGNERVHKLALAAARSLLVDGRYHAAITTRVNKIAATRKRNLRRRRKLATQGVIG